MAKFLFNPSVMTFSTTVPDMKPCTGVQKICGFTRGLSFHQVDYFPYWHISNSIVLGCNRSSQASWVKLWMYGYSNGVHFQEALGVFEAGTEIDVAEYWDVKRGMASIDIYNTLGVFASVSTPILTKTIPVGWLLGNYAEIDNTNNKTPFHCPVEDLRVNGRVVKI
jgi:hypothetical protein